MVFLRTHPFCHHKGQRYVVAHGELVPPKHVEKAKETPYQLHIAAKPARGLARMSTGYGVLVGQNGAIFPMTLQGLLPVPSTGNF